MKYSACLSTTQKMVKNLLSNGFSIELEEFSIKIVFQPQTLTEVTSWNLLQPTNASQTEITNLNSVVNEGPKQK